MEIIITEVTAFLGSYLLNRFLDEEYKVSIKKCSFSKISNIRKLFYDSNFSNCDIDRCNIKYISQQKINNIIHNSTECRRDDEPIVKILVANVTIPVKSIRVVIKYKFKSLLNADSYFKSNVIFY